MNRFVVMLAALVALGLSGCGDAGGVLAAGKGMVKIVTTPGDAKIFINGKRKGSSPSEPGQTFAIKLREGEYMIEVRKNIDDLKYYYAKKPVFVAEDVLQTVSLKLTEKLTELGEQKKREASAAAARKAAAEKAADEKRAVTARKIAIAKKKKQAALAATIKKVRAAKTLAVLKKFNSQFVKIKGGSFNMGCSGRCYSGTKPKHKVIVSGFYMSKYEITFDQWDACVNDGGCKHNPKDQGWGRGNRPVINISWNDTQEFTGWLNKKTGKSYRLPTEAEFEYAARAGTTSKYNWGNKLGKNRANCRGCGSRWDSKTTAPVGSFPANKWGLYDMAGNVTEWVHDWYSSHYFKRSPLKNPKGPKFPGTIRNRVLRGGGFSITYQGMFSSHRSYDRTTDRAWIGFRLVR